ncbi:Nicotinamide/nicotinic acid mononucleotide adenylyltransferase 1 [Cryptotrichosporon argae]
MSGNGFKSPAPVLPAMGLHSFHNDSPPFAGASMPDPPETLNLDEPLPATSAFQTPAHLGATPARSYFPTLPELDLAGLRLSAGASASASAPALPLPGADSHVEDAELSAARSRRLVSGYRFGNPPSPVGRPRLAVADAAAAGADDAQHAATTPPVGEGRDSPPLTEPHTETSTSASSPPRSRRASRPDEGAGEGCEAAGGGTAAEAQAEAAAAAGRPASAPAITGDLARRRASRSHDRDHGFDALAGLNDGEADLDETAPQAEAGTQGYLRGEDGEDGQYRFPRHRLRKTMKDESKIPLVIVACGSFSPPTYLHLRMFEMAKDEIVESQTYEIMAGYYSPVSSYYKKGGLAPAAHRVRMCELAVEHTSTWLMVDPWEAGQPEYQRTAVVLDHFDKMLNGDDPAGEGRLVMSDGKRRKYKIMLLAGGDLIESFGEPGVWSEPDLHEILGRFGCLIVERAGSDVWAFLLSHDILYHHRRNVIVIKQLIYNDISSTKVRLFVRRGMSIKYLLPNSVIQYIHEHRLYREADNKPSR